MTTMMMMMMFDNLITYAENDDYFLSFSQLGGYKLHENKPVLSLL